MICYNCGYRLPSEDMKDCPLCGMKFPIQCYSCKSPNPSLAKFCLTCGMELKVESQNSVQNFNILQENRKKVAVIFADVSGFTSLSEILDPEEVREIINDTFNYITKPVYELEGTIDKYIGDCVMILFGAKQSHSDDPRRAVACGLEMLKLIKEFTDERLAERGLSLDLSIGINYGLVVTGSVGNYFDKDYTVMGDIVNTAQRLQTAASKGSILVSDSVYMETKDIIEYSGVNEITVKNKNNPIKSYSPLHLKVDSDIDFISLIDRDQELNLFNAYLNSNFNYLAIKGEAGVGKTSLIRNLVSNYTENFKQIWINCSSSYQNRVYYVVSAILLTIMNLKQDDSNRVKVNRLKSFIDYLYKEDEFNEEEFEKSYNFMGLILGLDREKDFQNILNSMDYEDIQREILHQLTRFFYYSYNKYPFIVIIDDIQWADKGSLGLIVKLIKSMAENYDNKKSLFIFTSRYEVDEISNISTFGKTFELENLKPSGVKQLVARLLQCDDISEDFLDLVIKYTNGNPLFIREFITTINRKGKFYIENSIAYVNKDEFLSLPDTIESLILANLQELNDEMMEFLQIASVVGTDFNFSWVSNLYGRKFVDESILKLPLKLNLISLKTIYNSSGVIDRIYSFDQDLIRKVIYDSILNKIKSEYHKKLADFIEQRYKNDLEGYYETLGLHYKLAGVNKKAKDYYYKTAIKYRNDFNYIEALEHYFEYLDLINDNSLESKVVNAYIDIGNIYTHMSDYEKAEEYLNKALEIAELTDDIYLIKIMIADVKKELGKFAEALAILDEINPKIKHNTNIYGKLLQLKCSILSIVGDNKALEIAEQSEEILLKTKDYENLSETMSQAAIIYFSKGDTDNALYYLNKAYKYVEKTTNLRILLRVSGNLGIVYHYSGMNSKAQEFFQKAINLAKRTSNITDLIVGNINLGILYMEKGLFTKAEKLLYEAIEQLKLVSSIYQKCVTLLNIGELMYEKGEYDQALEYFNQSLAIAIEYNLPIEEAINYLGIIKVGIRQRTYDNLDEKFNHAYEIFINSNEIPYIGEYYRYKSIYEVEKGNLASALEFSEEALKIANETNNEFRQLKALRQKGNVLVMMGQYKKAIELYEQSIKLAIILESDYEEAKGHYRKHRALVNLNRLNESEIELKSAKEIIKKVDKSYWTEIILNTELKLTNKIH